MSCLGIALLLAGGPTWSAGIRTEGRAGTAPGGGSLPQAVVQVEPDLTLRTQDQELGGSLDYLPRLIFGQSDQERAQLLHRARASLEWLRHQDRRMLLEEQATYGRENFSPTVSGASAAQPIDPRLSTLSSVAYGSSSTALRFDDAPTRRTFLSAKAEYLVSGGLDDAARKVAPLQRGPRLSAEGRWVASRLDELRLQLGAQRTSFSSGPLANVLKAAGGLRSRLDATTTVELAAGASTANTSGGATHSTSRWFPLASASLATAAPLSRQRFSGGLSAQLSPVVDSLTGDVYERAEGRAVIDWSPAQSLSLSLGGQGAHNLGGPFPGQGLAQSVVSATIAADPRLALTAGVRASWLKGEPPGQAPFQWVGFVVASFTGAGAL